MLKIIILFEKWKKKRRMLPSILLLYIILYCLVMCIYPFRIIHCSVHCIHRVEVDGKVLARVHSRWSQAIPGRSQTDREIQFTFCISRTKSILRIFKIYTFFFLWMWGSHNQPICARNCSWNVVNGFMLAFCSCETIHLGQN